MIITYNINKNIIVLFTQDEMAHSKISTTKLFLSNLSKRC